MKLEATWLNGYTLRQGLDLVIRYKRFVAIYNYRSRVYKKDI